MRFAADTLAAYARAMFAATGSDDREAAQVATHLVEANLLGHDSHGIIRVPKYIAWVQAGDLVANRHATIAVDRGPLLMVDGGLGYGQVIAQEAMALAAERADRFGLAAVAIRNTAHLGRIGAWAEQLARAGLVSVHFVNTTGFGILVAPFGGSDRRLSANPIAAGAPGPNGPIVLDIATAAIAEGKLQVALNAGTQIAPGAILDGAGHPTTDPAAFYAHPLGAILPFGGHKGSGLSFFCEILAGALTGAGTSHPDNPSARRLVNNMLSIAFDPAAFDAGDDYSAELRRLTDWVRASPPAEQGGGVLLPGEIEARTQAARLRDGIPLDAATWDQLAGAARALGVAMPQTMEAPR
jgi:hydroxycarboxylate dehydrogenase B